MEETELTFLEPPLLKELLEQQKKILEIQSILVKAVVYPPMIVSSNPKANNKG